MMERIREAAQIAPSARQQAWQEMEFYSFIHFGINTFTNKEWGLGDEDPADFNPTAFNAKQWVDVCKSAGMNGLILTCKHHDGFCLWPSAHTDHSVKGSPWKGGYGDIVQEVSDACREGGIRFGVYLSPWDRHDPRYGTSSYNDYFKAQLRELLTRYGDIFCVWFDGACGEGPNGIRQVYDWDGYYQLIRELQPGAVINVCGPDVRWCGNEAGHCRKSEWSIVPAILNTSIRPGWFYHASEDDQVRSLDELLHIYYQSVGGNATFLLNLPPDQRGLIHENDAARMAELGKMLASTFEQNLALNVQAAASERMDVDYDASRTVDGNKHTFWSPMEGTEWAEVEIDLGAAQAFDTIVLKEHIQSGQRIERFRLEYKHQGAWKTFFDGTVVGYKRICRFDQIDARHVRLTIEESRWYPTLSAFEVYDSSYGR